MIMKMFGPLSYFSTASKYTIYKGKYLLPEPPKRSMTAYLLFSNDARVKLQHAPGQKVNIGLDSKLIAQQWKTIAPEQKQKYQKKAAELRKKYEEQKSIYDAKYVEPFKSVNYNSLMMKQFYAKNKASSFIEGAQAFQNFRKNLSEQQLASYKKMADETKKQNEKIKKLYEIPTLEYNSLNSYLLAERKRTPSIPKKSQMDKKSLDKYEKKYSEYKDQFSDSLKAFAHSFHIKTEDLLHMINKEKPKEEKINEKGQQLKELAKIQQQQVDKEIKKSKVKVSEIKMKAKKKVEKQTKKAIKQAEKQLEQKIRRKTRLNTKFNGKLTEIKRLKTQEQIKTSVEKERKKQQKKAKVEVAQEGNPTEPAKKTRGRPKSAPKTEAPKTEAPKTEAQGEAKTEQTKTEQTQTV